MGKLSITIAALGVIAQWLPIVRACPLAMRGLEWVAAVGPALSLAGRARGGRVASVVASASRMTLVASIGLLGALLPTLAYGSPPDPSWIQGIYDDADFDDVVILATSASGNVAPSDAADLPRVASLAWTLPELTEAVVQGCPTYSAQPRAPPAS